jgi:hypothetical protein
VKALFLGTATAAIAASLALPAFADDAKAGYSPPHVVDYAGGRVPEYAHLEERPNTKLIELGLAVVAAPYTLSVLYALGTCGAQMDCRSGSQWLYIPVVGPFMTAAQAPTTGGQALSVFDGALQLIGAGLAVAGVMMPRSVVVWQDLATTLHVAPEVVPGGAGLSVTMTSM